MRAKVRDFDIIDNRIYHNCGCDMGVEINDLTGRDINIAAWLLPQKCPKCHRHITLQGVRNKDIWKNCEELK